MGVNYFSVYIKEFLVYTSDMVKKRGRPKKKKADRLEASMRIRLSAPELKAIQAAADADEVSASEWVRIQLQKAVGDRNIRK